jgi:hypothetical protein
MRHADFSRERAGLNAAQTQTAERLQDLAAIVRILVRLQVGDAKPKDLEHELRSWLNATEIEKEPIP